MCRGADLIRAGGSDLVLHASLQERCSLKARSLRNDIDTITVAKSQHRIGLIDLIRISVATRVRGDCS